MLRQITAILMMLTSPVTLGSASAQTPAPASGDLLPDAVAGSCIRVVPTVDEPVLYNDCSYRVMVAACVPRNAKASLLCKTDGSEDISTKVFGISPRGNFGTGFPNGSDIYQIACKAPAKPVLVGPTSGKCLQP
jgi:hypothetical protein